jgi:cell division protein FtsW
MFKRTQDIMLSELPQLKDSGNALLAKARGDRYMWGIVIILSLISILVVYSATGSLAYKKYHGNTEFFLVKQLIFTSIGLLVIYFLHQVNYTIFKRLAFFALLAAIPLLIYTLFFGAKINDGSRWLKIPIINLTIQTSDFARLALFTYIAKVLSIKQEVITDFKRGFLPVIIPVVIVCAFILPANFSNAALTFATSLLIMYIGRISIKHLLLTISLALVPIFILISVAVVSHTTKNKDDKPIVAEKLKSFGRFETWVNRIQDYMYSDDATASYQAVQANIAIANGGLLFGRGPGNSMASNYLPQAYNDFIYAIIIEEYGILGGAIILLIYLLFLFRCIRIFRKFPYAFGAFLALGLGFTLVIQALANMAVSVGWVPVTGVTLPLVSMGGSSYLFTCASIGIILSVARNVEQEQISNSINNASKGGALVTANA